MISAARISDRGPALPRGAGFTILEMVVALAIIVLLMGGALGALYFQRDEAKLNDAVQTVEEMAKQARTVATLQQKPYALEFWEGGVRLMPLAEAMLDERERGGLVEAQAFAAEMGTEIARPPVWDAWEATPGMALSVMRWATREWVPLERGRTQVWRFDPNGICEPLAFRADLEPSWVQVRFHPLTASVTERESEIQ